MPSIHLTAKVLPESTKRHFKFPNDGSRRKGESSKSSSNGKALDSFLKSGPIPSPPYLPKSKPSLIKPRPIKTSSDSFKTTKAVQVSHVSINNPSSTSSFVLGPHDFDHLEPFHEGTFDQKIEDIPKFLDSDFPSSTFPHQPLKPPTSHGHISFGSKISGKDHDISDDFFKAPDEYCEGDFQPSASPQLRSRPQINSAKRIPYSPLNRVFGILGA